MSSKVVALAFAVLASGALTVVHAQDKTRAEVKAETRAAGVTGDASADKPTPTGKIVGGETRADVKAKTKAAGKLNEPAATYGSPAAGAKSEVSRAQVKAETRAAGVRGDAPADVPTPAPKK